MGTNKYQRDVEELFGRSPVVDSASIKRLVRSKKGSDQYAKQMIRNLVIKGKIRRLAKGYYTKYGDPSLAVFCFSPAYLGLQDALGFHNLWEQETIPVIVTSRKIRPGIREVMGANVLVRRLDRKYLFGFDYCRQGNFYLPYSDLEKTLIDMVYFKQRLDDGIVGEIASAVDIKKLKSYLREYPPRFRRRVLGYLDRHRQRGATKKAMSAGSGSRISKTG